MVAPVKIVVAQRVLLTRGIGLFLHVQLGLFTITSSPRTVLYVYRTVRSIQSQRSNSLVLHHLILFH